MTLILAEKKSAATAISAALNANERKGGFFIGNNRSPADSYIVTWCLGHLLEPAPPEAYDERYAKWNLADLPIIPAEWKYVTPPDKEKQLAVVSVLMNRLDVKTIVNACDAGREGQFIFQLVYDYCACDKPVKRLWINSLEDSAIRRGFDNLKDNAEYDNLYRAALCRAQADWIIGLNMTRCFSLLYGATLHVGRVQSPTLAMLTGREAEIAGFVSATFYLVELSCGGFTASGERFPDKAAAESVVSGCTEAVVTDIQRTEKSAAPPKLYDLTALQRECNRAHGFTAQQTLDYLQSLYEKQLASYPRSDSRFLTGDLAAAVTELVATLAPGAPCDTARVIDPSRVSDHHAVIPTMLSATADLSALPSGERTVLDMLKARLVCAVGEPHRYLETVATLTAGGAEFQAKGKTVIYDGWKSTATPVGGGEDGPVLPGLSVGSQFPVTAALKEGATAPPKPFTEDTLLSRMESAGADEMQEDIERRGLGTSATRAGVIEKMVKTGMVERKKKNLIPADKAKNLILMLPDSLKTPALTADWENRLLLVERGELDAAVFMDSIAEMARALVAEHRTPNPAYLSLFSTENQGDALGSCPRCGNAVREGKKGFFCDNKTCGFRLWKAAKFWTAKKKPLTAKIVSALLKDGRVAVKGLYSEKTGKIYDATVVLDDTDGEFVGYKLIFS